MPKRTDLNIDPDHRRRADRHRPGGGVRLFGQPGGQGAEGRGLSRDRGQFEPGDDHDRPRARRRDLYRAGHARRSSPRSCEKERPDGGFAAADDGRADRAQHRAGACSRTARSTGSGSSSSAPMPRRSRRPRTGSSSARRWTASGSKARARRSPTASTRRWARSTRSGLPAIIRPSFTLGGTGGGIAYNRDEFVAIVRGGLEASPTTEVLIEESVLGWKEYRDGGRARPRRQRHHHLLDREYRPDGGPYRRQHHRRAGADADRQGISAHALGEHRGAARNRGRNRRFQRPVRGRSRRPGGWW